MALEVYAAFCINTEIFLLEYYVSHQVVISSMFIVIYFIFWTTSLTKALVAVYRPIPVILNILNELSRWMDIIV